MMNIAQMPEPVPQPGVPPIQDPPPNDLPPLEVPPDNDPMPIAPPPQMTMSRVLNMVSSYG